jgi:hypothetical protein
MYNQKYKAFKDLNIRHETLKLLQEKIEKGLGDKGLGNYFLNRTPGNKSKN